MFCFIFILYRMYVGSMWIGKLWKYVVFVGLLVVMDGRWVNSVNRDNGCLFDYDIIVVVVLMFIIFKFFIIGGWFL